MLLTSYLSGVKWSNYNLFSIEHISFSDVYVTIPGLVVIIFLHFLLLMGSESV